MNHAAGDFFGVADANPFGVELTIVMLVDYAAYLLLTSSTAIAANRFTAIALPFSHERVRTCRPVGDN